MGKKITSIIVIAVALLLALPIQAQVPVVKKSAVVGSTLKMHELKGAKKVKNAIDLTKVQAPATVLETLGDVKAGALQKAEKEVKEFSALWEKNQKEASRVAQLNGLAAPSGKLVSAKLISRAVSPIVPFAPAKAAAGHFKAETKDAHGIITDPDEGEHKFYTRSGSAYYASGQSIYVADQSGTVEIVETEDGDVYVKDIISRYNTGAWVKGTKDGDVITIPVAQPVNYNTNYSTTLSVYWGSYDEENGFTKTDAEEITFSVDEEANTITLEGSTEDLIIGVFWDDDDSFNGYGDYETVWTLDEDHEEASTELVEAPANLQTETWYAEGTNYASTGSTDWTGTATVGFDGNDVYVKGIFSAYPDSWIKGTIDGTTVTFSNLQFIGTYSGTYNIWAAGYNVATQALSDIVFNYDALAGTLTLDASNYLAANAAEDRLSYLQLISALTISKDEPEAFVVDELPYVNDFGTSDVQKQFTIINANDDNSTWTFASGAARYAYNSTNNANDYLVSPAIKLQADKVYRIAVDTWAQSASYPERIEVLIGTEPTADAFTESVIASTDVVWNAAQTLENESVTVDEDGYYYIAIHAISDADQYNLYADNFTVEQGAEPTAPAAVTDLTVTPLDGVLGATVSFTAPSKAINGTDLASLTKVEIYRDGAVIKTLESVTPGSAQSYVDQADDLTIGNHTYQVIAYNEFGYGQKSEEVVAFLTAVLNVPYTADFTSESVFSAFQVIDNNGDDRTWGWSASNNAYYRYSSDNAGDDYLVSPALHLEAGKSYLVSVNARAQSASNPERFEVVAGKAATAAALNIPVIAATDLLTNVAEDYEGEFTVAETGDYYVAIHAISDADNYYIVVNSLSIEKGAEPTAPAAIADLAATAGAQGALEATITFTAPATAVNGSTLTENISKVEIYRDNEVVKEIENIAPGSAQSWTDTNVEEGVTYSYQAIAYNASGNGPKSAKVSVYVGQDTPLDVENLVAADQQTSIKLSWDAVTEGANGGYVNPAQVEYVLWTVAFESFLGYTYPVLDEKIDSVYTTSYVLDYDTNEGEQAYEYWGVQARNTVGESDGMLAALLVGAPYELPFTENFAGSSLHSIWDYANVSLYVTQDASDEDGIALKLLWDEEADDLTGFFETGKLDLSSAANPTLLFDLKTDAVSKLTVSGSKDGGESVTLKDDIAASADYTTVKVPLTAIADAEHYSRVSFDVDFNENPEDSFLIDNIRIVDLYEYDLAVDVKAAKSLLLGESTTITATVTNEGENAAESYTLIVKAGDKELLNKQVTEALAPFKSREFRVDFAPTLFDEAGDIDITAEVVYEIDLNDENNLAAAELTLKAPAVPTPENLQVAQADGKVTLTWDAPNLGDANAVVEVTEDFQAYDNGANETGLVGDWTLVDNNDATKGGLFEDLELANDGQAKAWQVFKPSEYGISNSQFNGPNGSLDEAYLLSAYNLEGQNYPDNDDWLISPELSGEKQTISFAIAALSIQYGNSSYEVRYSTTNKNVASFTEVATSGELTATGWNQVEAEIPAGAKYFAIVNNTPGDGALAVMLGDIKFTRKAGSVGEITAYNIYVDADFEDTVEDETSYEFEEDDVDGYHVFAVTAVYDDGTESLPATVALKVVTAGIESIMAQGKPVNVYTVDGKFVGKVATLQGLKKGIYVVNNKKVVLK